jgi:RNA recognition motif-containing protein
MSDEPKQLPWGLKETAPGSIKSLSKDQVKSFDQSNASAKKNLSKKEQEDLRRKQDEQAAAQVLEDYELSFADKAKSSSRAKMFIKASVLNPLSKDETPEKGVMYKPALKLIGKSAGAGGSAKSLTPSTLPKMSAKSKTADEMAVAALESKHSESKAKVEKKSNLELFKEELKRIQLDREERHKKRLQQTSSPSSSNASATKAGNDQDTEAHDTPTASHITTSSEINEDLSLEDLRSEGQHYPLRSGNYDSQRPVDSLDPNTTNLFISNLSPKTNEQDLIKIFGKYGLLASVKIMWPRSESEARNANCGFVAFMVRRQAEDALQKLDGFLSNNQMMRLSWSKSVGLPSQPIYIPPELTDAILPPPQSGLPFNAQPQEVLNINLKRALRRIKDDKKKRSSTSSIDSIASLSSSSSASLTPSSSSSSSSSSRRSSSDSSSSRNSSSSSTSSSSRSNSSSSSSDSSSSSSSSSSKSNKNSSLQQARTPKAHKAAKSAKTQKTLDETIVKVCLPTDRNLLCLIHRTIEFVMREGAPFEAVIMSKEVNNPQFRFLFDNQSPAHSYYRWKLYSLLHGETISKWSQNLFQMFKGGSYWKPPPRNRYTQGSPDEGKHKVKVDLELIKPKKLVTPKSTNTSKATPKTATTNEKLKKMTEILKNLTIERKSISDAMIYCVEHAERSEQICDYLKSYLHELASSDEPDDPKKALSPLYVMSDILHNCCVKVANVASYRRRIELILPSVFASLNRMLNKIDGKMKSEWFKQKVLVCIKVWQQWNIYPDEFLLKLKETFLDVKQVAIINPNVNVALLGGGIVGTYNSSTSNSSGDEEEDNGKIVRVEKEDEEEEDVDGMPLDDLDGVPL